MMRLTYPDALPYAYADWDLPTDHLPASGTRDRSEFLFHRLATPEASDLTPDRGALALVIDGPCGSSPKSGGDAPDRREGQASGKGAGHLPSGRQGEG